MNRILLTRSDLLPKLAVVEYLLCRAPLIHNDTDPMTLVTGDALVIYVRPEYLRPTAGERIVCSQLMAIDTY